MANLVCTPIMQHAYKPPVCALSPAHVCLTPHTPSTLCLHAPPPACVASPTCAPAHAHMTPALAHAPHLPHLMQMHKIPLHFSHPSHMCAHTPHAPHSQCMHGRVPKPAGGTRCTCAIASPSRNYSDKINKVEVGKLWLVWMSNLIFLETTTSEIVPLHFVGWTLEISCAVSLFFVFEEKKTPLLRYSLSKEPQQPPTKNI